MIAAQTSKRHKIQFCRFILLKIPFPEILETLILTLAFYIKEISTNCSFTERKDTKFGSQIQKKIKFHSFVERDMPFPELLKMRIVSLVFYSK